ncbi:hypothetical protein CC2G_002353 [Coprinopsis cinerea AmutBmut pab1-1]|nr:hypothetical protein CC2G_002353 [Coprinopsis cinerea AmutBmut pab1-1]
MNTKPFLTGGQGQQHSSLGDDVLVETAATIIYGPNRPLAMQPMPLGGYAVEAIAMALSVIWYAINEWRTGTLDLKEPTRKSLFPVSSAFQHDWPLQQASPDQSAFKVISGEQYDNLGEDDRADLYAEGRTIVILHSKPKAPLWNLSDARQMAAVINPSEEVTMQAPVRRIIDEAKKPLDQRRILNALSLSGNAVPHAADHSSDTVSWVATKASKGALNSSKFPVEAMNWSIAATAGASHAVHMDADGASTRREQQCRLQNYLDLDVFNTVDDSVCDGQHFFNVRTLVETFLSMVLCLCSGEYITNASHSEFLMVLHRMLLFQYGYHVEKVTVPEYQEHVLSPSRKTDIENPIALLVIGMTTEVFHHRRGHDRSGSLVHFYNTWRRLEAGSSPQR